MTQYNNPNGVLILLLIKLKYYYWYLFYFPFLPKEKNVITKLKQVYFKLSEGKAGNPALSHESF